MKLGRNDPCPCGSGKKYKHCCEGKAASRIPPPPAEISPLIALYNAGRYAELESRARLLTTQYPDFGFGWKLLGGALQMQGKNALAAFQKTAELMPNEADAHYNLGVVLADLGKLDDALASYRRAVKIKLDFAEAHNNLGYLLQKLAQPDAALASCRRALELKPDYAEAHNNLGNALKDLGRLDEAAASYRSAIKLKPDFALAHNNLGNALQALGQFDDALACCRRALEIKPDFAEAYNNLGNAQNSLGEAGAALASYGRAVEINPDYAEAHNNMGIVLLALGRPDNALSSCKRALDISPDYAEAYFNMGNTLKELGRLNEAVSSYRKALEIKPDFAKAHNNLGAIMSETEQQDAALECYRRALEIDPECIEAMLGIGKLFMESGNLAEAQQQLRRVLDVKPDNLDARFLFAQAKKVTAGDENFAMLVAMDAAAQNGVSPIPGKLAIPLHFALGKCFDDIGDYDSAFPHFIEGCKLKRATLEYDTEQTPQYFKNIMRVFDQKTIERLRGGGDPSQLPIFVLGMPRSGTTLTEQIIASHPEVYGAGELSDLMAIAQRNIAGMEATFPNNVSALNQTILGKWGADYVAGLKNRAPYARHITDKAPGNFFGIGLIHVMLPNAKIIHVNRNPVDTCLSCFMQLFSRKMEQSYDLSEQGRYYVEYARLMAHWRSVLPAGAFLDVQYEDIVADQETQARRIIAFCGLDWNEACIDFHNNKRSIRTASVAQVRQPIYNSSVERWRRYEKYLGPLLDALGDLAPKRN